MVSEINYCPFFYTRHIISCRNWRGFIIQRQKLVGCICTIEREKDTDYCNNMTMLIIEGAATAMVVVYKLLGIVLFTRDTPKQCFYTSPL